ncbi:outer membrane beta-barrel protein [Pontibacter sp. 13R65]|uniref:outer membrane beta-barrel protein n=1 Tax=Pontibacter sp. 13R65 TaxID=3127458 RepID=UPI00301D1DEA
MQNKFTYCCLLLALLTISATFAQKRGPEAYLITTANDTIKGTLKKQLEKERLRSIRFKPVSESNFTSYSPSQIKVYGVGDSIQFVAREVMADGQQQTVFLKLLVKGHTNLYHAEDLSSAGDYYVQRQGEKVVQLQKRHNLTELNYLLSDCPEVQQSTTKSRYSAKYLTSTIHAYNSCRHPDGISEVLLKPSKTSYLVGVRLGSHFGNIGYKGNDIFGEKNLHEKVAEAPSMMGGIFLNVSDERSNLMLQAELLFRNYNIRQITRQPRYTRTFEFKTNAIQVPLLLQFKLPASQKVQPYLGAGLSLGYLFKPTINHDISYEEFVRRSSRQDVEKTERGTIGFVAGGGVFYKLTNRNRLLLELRYSQESALTEYSPIGKERRTVYFSDIQLTTGITL